MVVVSGHDHAAPIKSKRQYTNVGSSFCVNVGQTEETLLCCLLDFEFDDGATFPKMVKISPQPWGEEVIIPRD